VSFESELLETLVRFELLPISPAELAFAFLTSKILADLSSAALDKKIRLLDLASLCARSSSAEVPYKEIASTLQIDESEVEIWVIDGEFEAKFQSKLFSNKVVLTNLCLAFLPSQSSVPV